MRDKKTKLRDDRRLIAFWRRLSERTATGHRLGTLLPYLLKATVQFFDAASGSIMLYDPLTHRLNLHLSHNHHAADVPRAVPVASAGVAGIVFRDQRPVLVIDAAHPPAGLELPRGAGGSFLSVPLRVASRTIGVLNLNRPPCREPFADLDLKMLSMVQGQMAATIEKTRLLVDLRQRREELAVLQELTVLLHQNIDLSDRLRRLVRRLMQRLDLDRCAILSLPEPLRPVIGRRGVAVKESAMGGCSVLAGVRVSPAVLAGIVASIHDEITGTEPQAAPADDDVPAPPVLRFREGGLDHGLFCLPLATRSGVHHALLVSQRQDLDDPEPARQHYRFLYLLARQIAVALERDEMLAQIRADGERLRMHAEQNELYLEISKDLASTLEPTIVLQKAFTQFHKLIDYATLSVLLYDAPENQYRLIIQPSRPLADKVMAGIVDEIRRIFRDYPSEVPFADDTPLKLDCWTPGPARAGRQAKVINEVRQTLHLPVILAGKLVGLIHLTSDVDNTLGRREMELTTEFTGLFLTSMKNAMLHQRTEKLAFTDQLTGLYDHRYFQDTLAQELTRSRRYGTPVTLMIMDIDHFKKFNDTWGHQLGDRVLAHVAQVFVRSAREKIDTVARYGGEEFVVILPETPLAGGANFAERVRQAVESEAVAHEGHDLKVTLSLGVASTSDSKFTKPSEMIEAADLALYQAKERGRNRVCVFAGPTLAQPDIVAANPSDGVEAGATGGGAP